MLTWIPPLQHLSRCHGDPSARRRKFSPTHTPMCLLGGRRGRFLSALLSPLMHKDLTCSCNDVGMALLSSTVSGKSWRKFARLRVPGLGSPGLALLAGPSAHTYNASGPPGKQMKTTSLPKQHQFEAASLLCLTFR